MKKITAVEWLISKLYDYPMDDIIMRRMSNALEMEKEQIEKAYNEGQNNPYEYSEDNEVNWYDGKRYYNETYKNTNDED